MSGQVWCRYCGNYGLTDRMVCSNKKCLAADLTDNLMQLHIEVGAEVSGASHTRTSVHGYGWALDAGTIHLSHSHQAFTAVSAP
jgi:hypothetical protein